MSVEQAFLIGLGMVVAFVASKAAGVAIEREYNGWGYALARFAARLVDLIHRSSGDCLAEVLHTQREEGRAALSEALWHLVSAPWLVLCDTRARLRSRRSALLTESGDFLLTETGDRILLEDGDGVPTTLLLSGTAHALSGATGTLSVTRIDDLPAR